MKRVSLLAFKIVIKCLNLLGTYNKIRFEFYYVNKVRNYEIAISILRSTCL